MTWIHVPSGTYDPLAVKLAKWLKLTKILKVITFEINIFLFEIKT